jgi:antitoxin component YwqK of YwqJK toxin-antitoxin module
MKILQGIVLATALASNSPAWSATLKGKIIDCEIHAAKNSGNIACVDQTGAKLDVRTPAEPGFTGTVREYDKDEKLLSIHRYKEAKQEGIQEEYFPNGSVKQRETLSKGLDQGLFEIYSKPGVPSVRSFYEGGKEIEKKEYYPSGKTQRVMHFAQDGKNDGLWESYYENGKLKDHRTYIAGIETGKSADYFENGHLSKFTTFVDGKETGLVATYFENGQLQGRRCWQQGRVENDMSICVPNSKPDIEEFWSNKKTRLLIQMKNGKRDGKYELNFDGGIPRIKGSYTAGQPSGTWLTYEKPNGPLKEKTVYTVPGKSWHKESYSDLGKKLEESDWKDGLPTKIVEYWENGKIHFERFIKPDKSSVYNRMNDSGAVVEEGRMIHKKVTYMVDAPYFVVNEESDDWMFYDGVTPYRFEEDVLDGPVKHFYSDGSTTESSYKDGLRDGLNREIDADGKTVEENVYRQGDLVETRDFSQGKVVEIRKFNADGSLKSASRANSAPAI